jgi:serine/threonine-protein kinase
MNNAQRHERAKAIFLEALAADPASRTELLATRCGADLELRRDVESLLEHAAKGSIETAVIRGEPPAERAHLETGEIYAGRYRIVTVLGRGAMGDVYRAVDMTLDVEVALKILRHGSPALVERLLEEVRLAREVTNPAVCRVYDVDRVGDDYFFTMELVDGEDLRALLARIGRLPGEKIREIGIQLCEGLAAAHERGVLHRDLKPSNIMLDGSGHVRITDFGIATSERASPSEILAGTPAYMAPEQLAGDPATTRTDLYAVGLVLYEALVGSAPAAGEDDPALARQKEDFAKPSEKLPFVDPRLETILLSLLRCRPEERPASAEAVAAELRALGDLTIAGAAAHSSPSPGTAASGSRRAVMIAAIGAAAAIAAVYLSSSRQSWDFREPSVTEALSDIARPPSAREGTIVAVLSVQDATADKSLGDFAECIQDDLIDDLSSVTGLDVIAEDSADRVVNRDDAAAIGRALGAEYVARGSLDAGERGVRITMTLLDTSSGEQVWTERYDHSGAASEMFETERKIVHRLLEAMNEEDTTAPASSRQPPTQDATAYSLYVRGRQSVPPFTAAEFRTSVAALTGAVEKDGRFADAHAALGIAYVTAAISGWIDVATGYANARRYAERAVALDPVQDEALVVLAIVAAEYEWNWRAAEDGFRNAIRVSPSSALAHRSYARFLSTQGRFEEALAQTGRAAELDPTSVFMLQGAAQRFYEARRYDRASAIVRVAIRLDPLYPHSYVTLGYVLAAQGRYVEAVAQMLEAVERGGRDATSLLRVAYVRALAGDDAGAAATEAEARSIGEPKGTEEALLAMARGDLPRALVTLRAAVDRRERPSVWLGVSPLFDPLRMSHEFTELVARVGLETGTDSDASAPTR